MYNQKEIIKVLFLIVAIQFILFFSYYIYTLLKKENLSVPITPQKTILTQTKTPPPKSFVFDKPIIKPEEKLVKKLKRIAPNSSQDIVTINSKLVKPILYTNSVPLSSLSITQKKQKFIDMMIPSILVAKHRIRCDRERVAELIIKYNISPKEKQWLRRKRKEFQALNNYELYDKMESHPTSIFIAQAIIESGWGTSKFFQKANNVFGIWSFSQKDNRMAASKQRGTKTIYLKKYRSMEESIYDYFVTISKKDNYKLFQKKRLETQDPYKLVDYLIEYSEQGEIYTQSLKDMIKKNRLIAYDSYQLDL